MTTPSGELSVPVTVASSRSAKLPVAIIGAGPYGLATAAHLRAAGVPIRVFGQAMGFWEHHMPVGMLLRSPWEGSHIADPDRRLTLDHYLAAQQLAKPEYLPLTQFVDYGKWFQQQAVPDLDPRHVASLEQVADGFRLVLDDGEPVLAGRVVVATGLAPFTVWPRPFAGLPREAVSHSSDHDDLSQFAGQHVLVIGSGQAALESAALLAETGANVEVIGRSPTFRFLRQGSRLHTVLHSRANPLRWAMFPPGNIGPPVINWLIEHPDVFRRLPIETQQRFARRGIRPAGAGWLRPRLQDVALTAGRSVVGARQWGDQLEITLDDGGMRQVDHVLLATGFQVDLRRYPWLAPELVQAVRRQTGYPELGAGFESSVSGLHFIGATADEAFGPLMRFVAGTGYTARSLTRHVTSSFSHATTDIDVSLDLPPFIEPRKAA